MTTANTHQFNIISLGKFIEIRWISMDSNDLWQEKSKTCQVWGVCKWIMGQMIINDNNCKYLPLHCYLPQQVYRMKTRPAWNPMPLTRRIEIICSLWHEFEVLLQGRWSKIMSTTNIHNITTMLLSKFTELRQNQHGFQKLWQGELKNLQFVAGMWELFSGKCPYVM